MLILTTSLIIQEPDTDYLARFWKIICDQLHRRNYETSSCNLKKMFFLPPQINNVNNWIVCTISICFWKKYTSACHPKERNRGESYNCPLKKVENGKIEILKNSTFWSESIFEIYQLLQNRTISFNDLKNF